MLQSCRTVVLKSDMRGRRSPRYESCEGFDIALHRYYYQSLWHGTYYPQPPQPMPLPITQTVPIPQLGVSALQISIRIICGVETFREQDLWRPLECHRVVTYGSNRSLHKVLGFQPPGRLAIPRLPIGATPDDDAVSILSRSISSIRQ